MTFDLTLAGAFFAGLLSFVSPCVLPIVPPYLCFLAGVSADELRSARPLTTTRWRILKSALFFVLGFATVFVALGATASSVGQLVTQYADQLAIVAGVVIIIMGLHFLGVFRIALFYRDTRPDVTRAPTSLLGAYVVGLAFAFGWTPCVGPILAAILFTAGAEETVAQGAILLGAYAAGIGLPFLVAAAFAGAFLGWMQRARGAMRYVEPVMGIMLIATGVLFITGQMREIAFWLLELFPALGQVG